MTIRKQILDHLERSGTSIYKLAKQAKATRICSIPTVYNYLSGKRGIDVSKAESLLGLLDELD